MQVFVEIIHFFVSFLDLEINPTKMEKVEIKNFMFFCTPLEFPEFSFLGDFWLENHEIGVRKFDKPCFDKARPL